MKRFTETNKWDDPWFFELSTAGKLFWLYLCDKCDNAGVVDVHERRMNFDLGVSRSIEDLLQELGDRVETLDNGKLHVKGFVCFQFGELKPSSNLHKNVISLLKNHGLAYPSDTLNEGFMKGPSKGTVKVKVKEEVKETIASLFPKSYPKLFSLIGNKGIVDGVAGSMRQGGIEDDYAFSALETYERLDGDRQFYNISSAEKICGTLARLTTDRPGNKVDYRRPVQNLDQMPTDEQYAAGEDLGDLMDD